MGSQSPRPQRLQRPPAPLQEAFLQRLPLPWAQPLPEVLTQVGVAEGVSLLAAVAHHHPRQWAQRLLQPPDAQVRAQAEQVVSAQRGQGGGEQVEHLPHIRFFEGRALSPLPALVIPPTVKVPLQAGLQVAQVFWLQAGGRLSPPPQVVHVQAHQQGVPLAQVVQFGDDVHAAAQFVQGKAHPRQHVGHALGGERRQVQGTGPAALPTQAVQPALRPRFASQVAGRDHDAQAGRRLKEDCTYAEGQRERGTNVSEK